MRSGLVAVYRGKEYSAYGAAGGLIGLLANDESDLALGFTPTDSGTVVLRVPKSDLDGLFDVVQWAVYRGLEALILEAEQGRLYIQVREIPPGEDVRSFRCTDLSAYAKWVTPDQLDRMWEERTPLM